MQGGIIKSRRSWEVFLGDGELKENRFNYMKLGNQAGSGRRVFQANGTVYTKPGFEREHGSFKEAERSCFPKSVRV